MRRERPPRLLVIFLELGKALGFRVEGSGCRRFGSVGPRVEGFRSWAQAGGVEGLGFGVYFRVEGHGGLIFLGVLMLMLMVTESDSGDGSPSPSAS